jgi:hypothetical protein
MYTYVLHLEVSGVSHYIRFTARDDTEAETIALRHIAEVYEGKCQYQFVSLVSNYDPRRN